MGRRDVNEERRERWGRRNETRKRSERKEEGEKKEACLHCRDARRREGVSGLGVESRVRFGVLSTVGCWIKAAEDSLSGGEVGERGKRKSQG